MTKIGLLTQAWATTRQIPVDYFQTVDSTSNYAKSMMNDPLENHHALHLVVAENQTEGRGRGLNTWVNPEPGCSLLSTWSYRLSRPPQPVMSARIGLALYKAALKVWPDQSFSLKAPNDLFLNEKKVAGLLIEVVEQGPHIRLSIGLGFNVFETPGLDTATCLRDHLSTELIEINWTVFLDELYREFQMACDQVSHQLNSFDCVWLLEALNKHKSLKVPFTKVDPDGSLWSQDKKIHWSEH